MRYTEIMTSRFIGIAVLAASLLLVAFPVAGQALPQEPLEEAEPPFPDGLSLELLLDAARGACLSWRPDWPVELPPDAFTLRSGDFVSLTLILEEDGGESDETASAFAEAYRAGRGPRGWFTEFPVFMDGRSGRGTADFDVAGELQEIRVDAFSLKLEVLNPIGENTAGPRLYALTLAGALYFVILNPLSERAHETWYDEEGNALAVMSRFGGKGRKRELIRTDLDSASSETVIRYDYDGAGNISAAASPQGNFSALYDRRGRPRYWERRSFLPARDEAPSAEAAGALSPADAVSAGDETPQAETERFVLQWDERDLLFRLSRGAELDFRYEYVLDERGNWIERREIPLSGAAGFLTAGPGKRIRRIIVYETPDEGGETGTDRE